jgi:hypothetical protein
LISYLSSGFIKNQLLSLIKYLLSQTFVAITGIFEAKASKIVKGCHSAKDGSIKT